MLHAHGRGEGEVLAHLRRWLLIDEERARRMLDFLGHPRWRTHTTTYVEGVRLLRPWLAARPPGQSSVARFTRLLDESWTPATLRASTGPVAAGPLLSGGAPGAEVVRRTVSTPARSGPGHHSGALGARHRPVTGGSVRRDASVADTDRSGGRRA